MSDTDYYTMLFVTGLGGQGENQTNVAALFGARGKDHIHNPWVSPSLLFLILVILFLPTSCIQTLHCVYLLT